MRTASRPSLGVVVLGGAVAVVVGVLVSGVASPPSCGPGIGSCPESSPTSTPVHPVPLLRFAPPATGLRFARSLLAGLSAPPGAKPSAPPAELRLPPGWGIAPNSDAARVWRVSLPALQVGRFFAEHPPRGTR